MKTATVQFHRHAPHQLLAVDDRTGEQPDGSIICVIENVPDNLPGDKLLTQLRGLFPTPGTARFDFADLPRRDGCCGGACG